MYINNYNRTAFSNDLLDDFESGLSLLLKSESGDNSLTALLTHAQVTRTNHSPKAKCAK